MKRMQKVVIGGTVAGGLAVGVGALAWYLGRPADGVDDGGDSSVESVPFVFTCVNRNTSEPIPGLRLEIGDRSVTTSSSGAVDISLPVGSTHRITSLDDAWIPDAEIDSDSYYKIRVTPLDVSRYEESGSPQRVTIRFYRNRPRIVTPFDNADVWPKIGGYIERTQGTLKYAVPGCECCKRDTDPRVIAKVLDLRGESLGGVNLHVKRLRGGLRLGGSKTEGVYTTNANGMISVRAYPARGCKCGWGMGVITYRKCKTGVTDWRVSWADDESVYADTETTIGDKILPALGAPSCGEFWDALG